MSFKITNRATTFLTVCGQCLSVGESIVIDAVTYAEWQETIQHLEFREVISVEEVIADAEGKLYGRTLSYEIVDEPTDS